MVILNLATSGGEFIKKQYIKIITYGNFPAGGASANYLKYFSLSLSLKQNNDIEVLLPSGHYYGKNVENKIKRDGKINEVRYKYLFFIRRPRNYLGKILDGLLGQLFLLEYLFIQVLKKKLNIIILYNITLIKSLELLIFKVFTKTKIIIIYPEFYEKPKKVLAVLKWYSFYFGIKYLSKYGDKSIVFSYFLKDYILKRSKREMDIFVLPNVMDPERFVLKNIKPFKDTKITIGYVGTPTRKDGIFDLIKAFGVLYKKYSNIHLLIIGDITNGKSILPKLKEVAVQYGVINAITFTGLVSSRAIPGLLNSCQILTLTRPNGVFAKAGFPTKLGEYFACRKPVVVTSVGDIKRYFKNNIDVILVEPENIESIVGGFVRLFNSKTLGDKLAQNAYRWMERNLDYKNISSSINDFILKSNLRK